MKYNKIVKKVSGFNIISGVLTLSLLWQTILYAYCPACRDFLRVPVGEKKTYEDIGEVAGNETIDRKKKKMLEEYKQYAEVFQKKIEEKGIEALLQPLLEAGKKLTQKAIRKKALLLLREFSTQAINNSVLEGASLVFHAPDKRGVMCKLRAEKVLISLLLFFDAEGLLKDVYIHSDREGDYHDAFVRIAKENWGRLDQKEEGILEQITARVKALRYEELEKAGVVDKQEAYQLLWPMIHDDASRRHIIKHLNNTLGMELLLPFLYDINFPIPEDLIYLRDLKASRGSCSGGYSPKTKTIFTVSEACPIYIVIHEAVHAVFDSVSWEGICVKYGSRSAAIDNHRRYRQYLYEPLMNYFRKSHLHAGFLSNCKAYRYLYNQDGSIVTSSESTAISEAFAFTVEEIIKLDEGVVKFKDIKFLVDMKIIPAYFWPEGLFSDFNKISEQYTTNENYFFPLLDYLRSNGLTDTAARLFDKLDKKIMSNVVSYLAEHGDNQVWQEVIQVLVENGKLSKFYDLCIQAGLAEKIKEIYELINLESRKSLSIFIEGFKDVSDSI